MDAKLWHNLQLAWDLYHVTYSSIVTGISRIKRLSKLAQKRSGGIVLILFYSMLNYCPPVKKNATSYLVLLPDTTEL